MFHIFSGAGDSLLDLLETMHHEIKILMYDILVFLDFPFDKIDISLIIVFELLIKGFEFMVKLRNLVRLLIGSIDKIFQNVFIELIFLIELLKGIFKHLFDLLLE